MANDIVFYRPKSPCFLPSFSLVISSQFGSNDPSHHHETRRYSPHLASAPTVPPIDFMKTIDLRSDDDSNYKFQYTATDSQKNAEDLQKENIELDSILEDNEDFDESFGRGAEKKLRRRRWAGIVLFFACLVPRHRLLWRKTSPAKKAPSDYLLDLGD